MVRDVVIVFPAITEARFFPYLSLPMITAYLRKHNVDVIQRDFNIELCHKLFSLDVLEAYIKNIKQKNHGILNLPISFRMELVKFLLDNYDSLHGYTFERNPSKKNETLLDREIGFIRKGVELLLEGSIIKKEITSLEELGTVVENYGMISQSDLPVQLLYKMLNNILIEEKPRIFAISIAYYSQILPSLLLAKWVKERSPETLVVFGGQQIMLYYESLVKIPAFRKFVDCLGIGVGEETMVKLNQFRKEECNKEEIPDLIWVNDYHPSNTVFRSSLHIKDTPVPDFSGLPVEKYMSPEVQLATLTCIGCFWGRCVFCSYGNRSRKEKNYQQKTATQIADDCQSIVSNYNVRRVNFVDENTNLRLIMSAMKVLNNRGYFVEFSTRCRMEDIFLDKEFCREFHDRGCVQVSVGYETNSQRVLDILDKGVSTVNYQKIVDNLYEANISLRLNVMGGLPTETLEEAKSSEEFLKKNEHKIGIDVIQMLVAEPKTFLTEDPQKFGITLKEDNELRGNKSINYGMGRMGFQFDYEDNDNYESRKDRLLDVLKNVNPAQNDEIHKPPLIKNSPILEIVLHPWIKIVESRTSPDSPVLKFFLNLFFQKVLIFPEEHLIFDNDKIIPINVNDEETQAYLRQLIEKGLGRAQHHNESVKTS